MGWLPLYHDMGLIGNVLQPLHAGGRCVLMSPVAFLQRPMRWLEAISRYRATTSGGPNFAYELCVRKVDPGGAGGARPVELAGGLQRRRAGAGRDAGALRRGVRARAASAREAFYPATAWPRRRCSSPAARRGGPRVAAVDAAALERNEVVPAPRESRGPPPGELRPRLDGAAVVVVDPETGAELPPGRVGEIWVAGPSVARGYWEQPGGDGARLQRLRWPDGRGAVPAHGRPRVPRRTASCTSPAGSRT